MEKKGSIGLVIAIVLGMLVIGGVAYGVIKIYPQEAFPSSGCQFIPNEDDPEGQVYTKILPGVSRYVCDSADECIVSGEMNVEESQGVDSYQCIATGCVNPISFSSLEQCTSTAKRCGSGVCSSQNCQKVTSEVWKANFNFCPVDNPDFPYCSKSENTVYSEGRNVTDSYKLLGPTPAGEVLFDPKYPNNNPVTDKTIYVKEYDCSCSPAVEDGDACSSEQKYCQRCPSGYNYDPGYYTGTPSCRSTTSFNVIDTYTSYLKCDGSQTIGQSTCGDWGTQGVCTGNQRCFLEGTNTLGVGVGGCKCPGDECVEGAKEQGDTIDSYKVCEDDGTGCFGWSQEYNCPGEDLIFSQEAQECVCDPDLSCTPNIDDICVSDTSIKKCKAVSDGGKTCYRLGDAVPCGNDYTCDIDKCVLKSGCQYNNPSCDSNYDCINNECIPKTTGEYCDPSTDDSYCLSETQLKSCESIGGGVYKWKITPSPDNKKCENRQFVCRTTGDYCISSALDKCGDENTKQECLPDGDGCYAWKDIPCDFDKKCFDGECVKYGCEFGTDEYKCATTTDSWGVKVEQCISNECLSAQDTFTATLAEYNLGETKCYVDEFGTNIIVKPKKYTLGTETNFVNVYRWESDITCAGGTPICFGDKIG